MGYTISKVAKNDLIEVMSFLIKVFGERIEDRYDVGVLDWLFQNPEDPQDYNGFIARDEQNIIVGIIGYALNEYQFGESVLKGVIPFSWIVEPSARGILGLQLLVKAVNAGDFAFGIQGSKMAQKTIRAVRFQQVTNAYNYNKVNRVYQDSIFEGISLKSLVKSIIYFGRRSSLPKGSKIEIGKYQKEISDASVCENFAIRPTESRNQWILKCPAVKSKAFSVYSNGTLIGSCICYIATGQNNIKRGRIISLPDLNRRKSDFRSLIYLVERYLIQEGCVSISILALNPTLRSALRSQRYKSIKRLDRKKVFIKDPGNLIEDRSIDNWFITYYESDKGYRNF